MSLRRKYDELKFKALELASKQDEVRFKDLLKLRIVSRKAISHYLKGMIEEGALERIVSKKTKKSVYIGTPKGMAWYFTEDYIRNKLSGVMADTAILITELIKHASKDVLPRIDILILEIGLTDWITKFFDLMPTYNNLLEKRKTIEAKVRERISRNAEEIGVTDVEMQEIMQKAAEEIMKELKETSLEDYEEMVEIWTRAMAEWLKKLGKNVFLTMPDDKTIRAILAPLHREERRISERLLRMMPPDFRSKAPLLKEWLKKREEDIK